MDRVLITGAAGGIGRSLRDSMLGVYRVLRLSDRVPLAVAHRSTEVAFGVGEDHARSLSRGEPPQFPPVREARLLEIREIDRIVGVPHRVAIAEADFELVNEWRHDTSMLNAKC